MTTSPILRYYTTEFVLNCRTSSQVYWTKEYACGYATLGCWIPSHVFHSTTLAAIPPFATKSQFYPFTFRIVPAFGFEKEPDQPVYMGDPIQLIDASDQYLGQLTRFPYTGHISPHNGANPLVLACYPVEKNVRLSRKSVIEICHGDWIQLKGIALKCTCQVGN